jgi:hypothetical protein
MEKSAASLPALSPQVGEGTGGAAVTPKWGNSTNNRSFDA